MVLFTFSHTPILDVKIVFAQDVIPFVFRIRSEAITRVLVFPPVNNYHRFLIHKVGRWVESICAIAHQFDAHKSSRLVVIDKQILSCCLNCCFSCPPHKSKNEHGDVSPAENIGDAASCNLLQHKLLCIAMKCIEVTSWKL